MDTIKKDISQLVRSEEFVKNVARYKEVWIYKVPSYDISGYVIRATGDFNPTTMVVEVNNTTWIRKKDKDRYLAVF